MSSDSSDHPVVLVRRDADTCVLAVSGELSLRSAGLVRGRLSKALSDPGRVLVDASELQLSWKPAIQLFPSVLARVGGWPGARLVLFGAGVELTRTLAALRVEQDGAGGARRSHRSAAARPAPTGRRPTP